MIFDHDSVGNFDCGNLRLLLCESMKENGVNFDDDEVTQLVQVLMDESLEDSQQCHGLNYMDMKALLAKGNGLATALALRYASRSTNVHLLKKIWIIF